jgi:hypothetical protein
MKRCQCVVDEVRRQCLGRAARGACADAVEQGVIEPGPVGPNVGLDLTGRDPSVETPPTVIRDAGRVDEAGQRIRPEPRPGTFHAKRRLLSLERLDERDAREVPHSLSVAGRPITLPTLHVRGWRTLMRSSLSARELRADPR